MTRNRKAARRTARTLFVAIAIALAVGSARHAAAVGAESERAGAADSQLAAERELAQARKAVAQARAAFSWAKADLDQAAAAQLNVQKAAGQDRSTARFRAQGDPAAKPTAAPLGNSDLAKAAVESLRQKIASVKAECAELLAHVTAAHPLVQDADARLAELVGELAALNGAAGGADTLPMPTANTQQAAQLADADARLQQAMGKWEAAQQQLQAAIDAETAAGERLALSKADTMISQPAGPATVPTAQTADIESAGQSATTSLAPAAPPAARSARQPGSQPWVLVALFVALVVAALASVKLARTTDDSVFSGADDAAAVLALPVVGVIPALSGAAAHDLLMRRFRVLVLLGQLLAAIVIFAAVAYFVQHPALLW